MKRTKYELQTLEETLDEYTTLVVNNKASDKNAYQIKDPEEAEVIYITNLHHARSPGFFPNVEQEAYVEVGGNIHRLLQISDSSAKFNFKIIHN